MQPIHRVPNLSSSLEIGMQFLHVSCINLHSVEGAVLALRDFPLSLKIHEDNKGEKSIYHWQHDDAAAIFTSEGTYKAPATVETAIVLLGIASFRLLRCRD